MLKGIIQKLLIVLVCTVQFFAAKAQQPGNAGKPNVLFIAVDDLRPQLGCYGDPVAITPNIDRLAGRGIVFNRAYCQQAVCAPSRASIMTGRRPDATKVWNLSTHFRSALPDVVTLPQYFKQRGYHAQSVGKIYHDPASAQDPVSWSAPEILAVTGEAGGKYALDSNLNKLSKKGAGKATATEGAAVPDTAYVDGRVGNAAVKVLNGIKDKPFFLAVGFRRPHLPFSAPAEYWAMYDRESLPLPPNPEPPSGAPEIALHPSTELRGYTDIPEHGPISPGKIRELIHGYYASVSFMDAQIGKLLDELDRLGLAENTIIVLWSDHGYHLGEHGLWCKTTNFELDTRVPLIISAPGQAKRGISTNALVELVDVYPTLAELAGLPIPEGLEGRSMAPLLSDAARPWKKAAFSQFPRPWFYGEEPELMGYSVRTAHYRYTEWRDFGTGKVKARELYDHQRDALEMKNIAGKKKYSKKVKELSQILENGWHKALPAQ